MKSHCTHSFHFSFQLPVFLSLLLHSSIQSTQSAAAAPSVLIIVLLLFLHHHHHLPLPPPIILNGSKGAVELIFFFLYFLLFQFQSKFSVQLKFIFTSFFTVFFNVLLILSQLLSVFFFSVVSQFESTPVTLTWKKRRDLIKRVLWFHFGLGGKERKKGIFVVLDATLFLNFHRGNGFLSNFLTRVAFSYFFIYVLRF